MLDEPRNEEYRRYEVRLGYAAVTVQGGSIRQVLDEARRRLCQEMPRLWDLIRSATDDRFEIRELA
jgi:hypothetical protein